MRASDNPSAQLARGESLHTEFKAWPIPPDDLAAAIVAFANTDGGRVFLGVDDLGIATGGVDDLDRATQFVDNVAFNNCSPPVTVLQETVETVGGTVLAVNVPRGDDRPYRTNRGVFYIRTSSGRRHASRGELLRLFQSSDSLFYDETPVARSVPGDRDEDATDEMLEAIQDQGLDISGIPRDRLLHNWGLGRRPRGRRSPHRGWCVAAGPCPATVLSARVRLGVTHPRRGHRDATHRSKADRRAPV